MKVGIGNDHAAVELKMQIKEFIESMGHEVVNYGVDTAESCNCNSQYQKFLIYVPVRTFSIDRIYTFYLYE